MDSTTAIACNVTLINFTEQETFNTTSSKIPELGLPIGYYGDTRALLWRVLPPILISVGTIGNAITIFVLLRQKKMTSTALYLFALAISDTIMLFSGLLPQWVLYSRNLDILWLSNPGCTAQVYLIYSSYQLSSWLIVAVTLERVACVLFPHKVRLGCSPRNAGLIIVTIVLTVFGINIIVPVIHNLNGYESEKCAPSTKEYRVLWDYYKWINFTLYFDAPFPLLLIGNVIIVVHFARSRCKRHRMRISGKVRDTRPASMLAIALCVQFFLTMTPVAVIMFYYSYRTEKIRALASVDPYTAWYDAQYLTFQYTVVSLVSFFDATFTFVIYVFSGSKFRAELKSLLCCKATKGTSRFGR